MCSLYTGNSTAEHDFLLIAGELLRYRKAAGNITESIFFLYFWELKEQKSYTRGKKLSNYTFCANHRYFIGNDSLTWNRLFQKSLSFRVPYINVATSQKKRELTLRNMRVTIVIGWAHRSWFIFVCLSFQFFSFSRKNYNTTLAWSLECHFSMKISCP